MDVDNGTDLIKAYNSNIFAFTSANLIIFTALCSHFQ